MDVFDKIDFDRLFSTGYLERPYFDRQGRPLTLGEWARRFESGLNYRLVDFTELRGGVRVSTVWLGLDHSFGFGPPLIFETMVFGGPLDGEMMRYPTEAQAIRGHRQIADLAGQAPWILGVGGTLPDVWDYLEREKADAA